MIRGPQIRIMRNARGLAGFSLQVWIEQINTKSQSSYTAKPIIMEEVKDIFVEAVPTLTISSESGQQLMDDLWQAGLRPSEGTGSAGALAAVEKHLTDMRIIAFNRLKIGEIK